MRCTSCLTQRFVDRRTSALMQGMRDKDELNAEIAEDGAIHVENHYVGRLKGFRFSPDAGGRRHPRQGGAQRGGAGARRASWRCARAASPPPRPTRSSSTRSGRIVWRDEEIAQLEAGRGSAEADACRSSPTSICAAPDREKVQARLEPWLAQTDRREAEAAGRARRRRGHRRAWRAASPSGCNENFGVLKREAVAEEIKALDQTARAQLRKYGVRFGAFNIYFPVAAEAGGGRAAADAVGAEACAARTGLSLDALPEPPRAGPDLGGGRSGNAGGVLSRLRLPRVRAARGAPRHARAAGRSDPAAACVARQARRRRACRRRARPATAASR